MPPSLHARPRDRACRAAGARRWRRQSRCELRRQTAREESQTVEGSGSSSSRPWVSWRRLPSRTSGGRGPGVGSPRWSGRAHASPDSTPRRDCETAPLGEGAIHWGRRSPNALLPGPLDLCKRPLCLVSSSLLRIRRQRVPLQYYPGEYLTSFESGKSSPSRSDTPDSSYPRRETFFRNESLRFSSLGMLKKVSILWSSPRCTLRGIPWPLVWKNPYCAHALRTSETTRSLSPGDLGLMYALRSIRGSVTSSVDMLSLIVSGSEYWLSGSKLGEDEGCAKLG